MRRPEPCRRSLNLLRSIAFSTERETSRLLVFCDEAADIGNPIEALQQALDRGRGDRRPDRPRGRICRGRTRSSAAAAEGAAAVPGARILRADTAGVAALALVQAALGDWRGPG